MEQINEEKLIEVKIDSLAAEFNILKEQVKELTILKDKIKTDLKHLLKENEMTSFESNTVTIELMDKSRSLLDKDRILRFIEGEGAKREDFMKESNWEEVKITNK